MRAKLAEYLSWVTACLLGLIVGGVLAFVVGSVLIVWVKCISLVIGLI